MHEFDNDIEEEEIDDYLVYDSEYKKTVPVSRLMNNRKKLSDDEKKIRKEILAALRADEMLNERLMREEAEKRRLAREERLRREEEERRLREQLLRHEVEIRYSRSFTSRLIQTEDIIKDYYSEIKNELLSYKGVKARTSWSKESFKRGRVHLAKLDVKGKTLYLYLALNPAELDGTKYNILAVKGDHPTLIKIKGERKKKHAIELIAMLMEKNGIVRIERESEDYRLPYEETEALIERKLIKIILPKGEVLDENAELVKADLSGLRFMRKSEEEVSAPIEEDTAAVETSTREIAIRYSRSFTSRLIQTEDIIKDYYSEIKNELLSYKGVKARTSWSKESFKRGRVHLAKLDVKGKTLYLYLALNPAELDGTKYNILAVKGDHPTLIKIKGERKKKHAIELIAMLMEKNGIVRIERESEDYRLPYEETEALIERKLIKIILPKGEVLDENAELVKADLSGLRFMRKAEEETPEPEKESIPITEEIFEQAAEPDETIQISELENKRKFKATIDKIAEDLVSKTGKVVLAVAVDSEAGEISDTLGFIFKEADSSDSLVVIPYTKEQYFALSRRKIKSANEALKSLMRYGALKLTIDYLHLHGVKGKRVRRLEARLRNETKLLPAASLWSDAVKRVTK